MAIRKATRYIVFSRTQRSSLAVERLLHVALPRHWDYDVDRRVNQSLSDLLGRNQYFLAVGRYLKPIVKTGLVGRMPCLLDIDDVDFDIFSQRAQDVTRPRWQRLLYSAHSLQIEAAFKKWLPRFHGLWVVKAGDTRYEVTRNAAILPNIPYQRPGRRSSTERFEIGKSHRSHRREFSITYPIARELIDSFARDGQRSEQPVRRRSIGWRARTIRRWPGAGKRSLASRSWDLLTILLRLTRRVGLRSARFGLERVRISKSWRAWLSGGHASRRSSVIEASKIVYSPVILCWWQQIQKIWRRIVSD